MTDAEQSAEGSQQSDGEVGSYVDIRDIHPGYSLMECWNCGHTEWVGLHRRMRICHNCFMDNEPTDHETSSTVEGPDGEVYMDYRQLWYGDVSIEEAQRRYDENTKSIKESIERDRARERAVRV